MTPWNNSRFKHLGVAALVAGSLIAVSAPAQEAPDFRYDEKSAATASYFAAITNLVNAVMFSGLGETLVFSPYERDQWLRRAGYVTRPPMPDLAAVGAVYAAAEPRFGDDPDFSRPETLAWDASAFDRTLDPGAQAWAMIKITSPEFHLQYHRLPENKLAGLMMVPQARLQAETLERRLLGTDGLFAALAPDGKRREPTPRDQAAVLWAASNLILAGTSPRDNYWHAAYRDLTDADDYRGLAHKALAAVVKRPPTTAAERGLVIEALGRFALATREPGPRQRALELARENAEALEGDPGGGLEDLGLAVYGLTEAGRLLGDRTYGRAAAEVFRTRLLPLWDEQLGLFRTGPDPVVYTPRTVGALVAALNAVRWYGEAESAAEGRRLYPRFFETAVVRSGLLRASPLPLVAPAYREAEPDAHFAHPVLPDPARTGTPPVFASRVSFENGRWTVSDPTFRTADALFLANMLAMRHQGRADTFLPADRLSELHR